MTRSDTILRARWVWRGRQPPLEDGAVAIHHGRIVRAGPYGELRREAKGKMIDLGEVVLLPGLVNAHCHLDYTGMAGQLPPPRNFPDWIKALLGLKAHLGYTEYAEAWLEGARMLLRNGVTTVADIEAVPELLPDVLEGTPLRVFSFLEMTGIRSGRTPYQILREALERIDSMPKSLEGRFGLSPHALYSTLPQLLRLSAKTAKARGWVVTTHLAESESEFRMFSHADGQLYDWLKTQRDTSDCGPHSPVQLIDRHGLLAPNFLAVHVNYLAPGDAALLARRGASVVHCPRSHEYFAHQPFPFAELKSAGVNVCLGTDSLASVRRHSRQKLELDLLAEMRLFAKHHPQIPPEEILMMATVGGARALGLESRVGEVRAGAWADLIAIRYHGNREELADHILAHKGAVDFSMIEGRNLADSSAETEE